MAQSLDDFIAEAKEDLRMFEEDWRKRHAGDQETFPLEMADGNEGLWWEFLSEFVCPNGD